MKIPPSLSLFISTILFFFFFFFFFFFCGCSSFFSNINHVSIFLQPLRSNRRLLSDKFDFTPFLNNSHRLHHWHLPVQPQPAAGTDFDPRYDAQNRLVPTGPNPLHH
ncbi:hypothetical protein MANES_01G021100v8 [Manihot esculenta]|uniref:Uncharacterized protein n=1 Tax=Manihot esculenta TaxID=3983 RepID=A0A2C9WJJ7_MANES|nr:hypothetical protein MANES_01G021100v8 [Manihot esculenta]